jgi:uncharacterized protein YcfJ
MRTLSVVQLMLGFSLSILLANSALADREHKHHRHNDERQYVRYTSNDYDDYGDYGRVIGARPIYQTIAVEVPSESCRIETVKHYERRSGGDSFTGTLVGGLVGAAIGHELGHGRSNATAVGGLIGASIGHDASRGSRRVDYRNEEICNTYYRTDYENRIVGYDVSYSYGGRIYQTRTDRHPGDSIPVAVNVRTQYRD